MTRPDDASMLPTKRSIDQGGRAVTVLSVFGAVCLAGLLLGLIAGLLS